MCGRAYGGYPYLVPYITKSSEEIQLTPFTSSPPSKKPKKAFKRPMRGVGFCTLLENGEMGEQGVKSTDRTHAG
jgi:hypothetical protein